LARKNFEKIWITLALGMHLSDKGYWHSGKMPGEMDSFVFDAWLIAGCRAPEDPAGEVKP